MVFSVSRRDFIAGHLALAGSAFLSPALARTERPNLPIPTLMDGSSERPVPMTIQTGQWNFLPGMTTRTYGFNGGYLGPTIRTRKDSQLKLRYKNTLNQGVSVHGHGLHVPGHVDGGPQLEMPSGAEWNPDIDIVQRASTCWYHSHTHGRTGFQTYHGLAGMIIIDDEESDALPIPKTYGIDDIPVILQDRKFDDKGGLVYSLMDAGHDGWFGDRMFINGAENPMVKVPAGKVRLRLLNGANARFFLFGFSDQRIFHKIATDGGFLTKPQPLTCMEIAPGERVEIIVDLSDGKDTELVTWFEDIFEAFEENPINIVKGFFTELAPPMAQSSLALRVDPSLTPHTAALPEKLSSIDIPETSKINVTRDFMLTMELPDDYKRYTTHDNLADHDHAMMDMGINGVPMNMGIINERVKQGQWERWRFQSDMGAHPFHIHGCSFLVETVEGEVVPLDQHGWKDTVMMDDDVWTNVIVKFDYVATDAHPYMYHCHILEHEDRGMMGQFTVT